MHRRFTILAIYVVSLGWPRLLRAAPADGAREAALQTLRSLWQPSKLLAILGIFLGMWLLIRALRVAGERLGQWLPQRRVLLLQWIAVLVFLVYILGILILIAGVIEPSTEALIALGGAAGVAVGFALKDLVASVIAGMVILFDRPFWVGDRIRFRDIYGDVQEITLRTTRVRTLDDTTVTIPNDQLMRDLVSSANSGAPDMMVICDIHVDLHADLDLARRLLREVADTSRYVSLGRPVDVIVHEVQLAHLLCYRLRLKAYVIDTRFEQAMISDINRRVAAGFERYGVKRPSFVDAKLVGE